MKKFLLMSFALVSAMLIFAACGGGNNASATTPNAGSESIVLRVSESLGGPDNFIIEAGRRFTEQNPHITIEFVNVEVGGAVGEIELDGPLGIGPDVFAAPHDQMGALIAGGHILPLTSDIEEWVRSTVFDSGITAVSSGGMLFGYPIAMETYALFYNRDLIASEDVPTTFEDLKNFSRDFSAENPGSFGFVMTIGAYYTIIFTTADGNRLFGPYGIDQVNSNINSPASVRGMEFFQSLREVLDMDAGDLTDAFADANFTSGNAAMIITGPWNISPFENQGVNFGVTTIPSLPGQANPPASFAGVRTMFVSAYTEHPAEAHAFAQFLISPEIQRLRYEITGAIPSTTVETESPHFAGFFRQLDFAFPMPSIPEMGSYWPAMDAAAANIWNGMSVQEQLDMAHSAMVGN